MEEFVGINVVIHKVTKDALLVRQCGTWAWVKMHYPAPNGGYKTNGPTYTLKVLRSVAKEKGLS